MTNSQTPRAATSLALPVTWRSHVLVARKGGRCSVGARSAAACDVPVFFQGFRRISNLCLADWSRSLNRPFPHHAGCPVQRDGRRDGFPGGQTATNFFGFFFRVTGLTVRRPSPFTRRLLIRLQIYGSFTVRLRPVPHFPQGDNFIPHPISYPVTLPAFLRPMLSGSLRTRSDWAKTNLSWCAEHPDTLPGLDANLTDGFVVNNGWELIRRHPIGPNQSHTTTNVEGSRHAVSGGKRNHDSLGISHILESRNPSGGDLLAGHTDGEAERSRIFRDPPSDGLSTEQINCERSVSGVQVRIKLPKSIPINCGILRIPQGFRGISFFKPKEGVAMKPKKLVKRVRKLEKRLAKKHMGMSNYYPRAIDDALIATKTTLKIQGFDVRPYSHWSDRQVTDGLIGCSERYRPTDFAGLGDATGVLRAIEVARQELEAEALLRGVVLLP